jgi:serine/threonine protein kinase
MSEHDPRPADLSADDRRALDHWLVEFDHGWENGLLSSRVDQIPPGSSWRLPALAEMVKIDLERQWERGNEIRLEAYLEQFPELGAPGNVSADLIQAEYEVRKRFGAPVTLDDYLRRFPHQAAELGRLIAQGQSSLSPRSSSSGAARSSSSSAPVRSARAKPEPFPRPFGRYQLLKRLGEGGMGSVYLAEDTTLARRVALKIPLFGPDDGPEGRERFFREARAAATLDHPYLCPVYDVGEIEGQLYLTMAYIEGKSLAESLRGEGLPPRQVAALVGKLALALEAAHAKGVVHRDLKPANVMIKASGQRREPVIVDFGLARRDDADEVRVTKTGQVMGTLGYMSPEQIRGDKSIGPPCDIYALGVMLYELLTGQLPFTGTGLAVAGKILTQDPLPMSELRPDLDPRLEAICRKAMAKKIQDRYPSMSALAAALTDYLKAATATVTASPGASAPPQPADPTRESGSHSMVGKLLDQLADTVNLPPPPVAPAPAPPSTPASFTDPTLVPEPAAPVILEPVSRPTSRQGIVAAANRAVGGRRRIGPLIAAGAAGIVILGFVLSLLTSQGTIRIAIDDPNAVAKVDGENMSTETLDQGITLRTGKHTLDVRFGNRSVQSFEFVVARGKNDDWHIEYTPSLEALIASRMAIRPAGQSSPPISKKKKLSESPGSIKAVAKDSGFPNPPSPVRKKQQLPKPSLAYNPPSRPFPTPTELMDAPTKAQRDGPGIRPSPSFASKTSTAKPTMPEPEFEPPVPGALIDENFGKVPDGQLPDGWTAQRNNAAVKPASSGGVPARPSSFRKTAVSNQPALELNDPAHSEEVDLPPIELAEDFVVETDFLLRTTGTCLRVQLQGKSTEILNLDVYSDGYVQAQDRYSEKCGSFTLNTLTRLRLERRGTAYRVLVNGVLIGQLPISIGKVKFKAMRLFFGPKAHKPPSTGGRGSFGGIGLPPIRSGTAGRSPQIFLVRVLPSAT